MTKSDQIRTHFLYHPNAKVLEVVEKFKASKPMVYKLHKEARARLELMKNAELPDTVPMPTAEHEATSRAASLISRAKLTDKQRKERTEKYFPSPAKAALSDDDDDDDTQVYKKPWVGLTGDEIEDLPKGGTWWEIIRAAEAILREKNGG